jgi:predicted polyphosphate/ATP-dependent NAD kinase
MLRELRRKLPVLGMSMGLLMASPVQAGEPHSASSVKVECSRSSAFIQIQVLNHRRIGNVVLEVRDAEGRTLYREEGKAMTEELVRRLDKGVFPRGQHTLTVTARDLSITQAFTIE